LRKGVALVPPQPADMNQWVERATTGAATRAALHRRAWNWRSAKSRKQRAGHYPTLDLVATRGNSAQTYNSTVGSGDRQQRPAPLACN
jgi:outer membrane protein